MRLLTALAPILALTVSAPAFAADDIHVKLGKIGANLAGYNYHNYEYCGASAGDLATIKAKDRVKFANAGPEFDASFAAGVADSVSKQNTGISQLGEAKYKASICPNVLKNLQEKLVK